MRRVIRYLASVGVVVMMLAVSGTARGVVPCRKKNGTLVVRETCKPKEVAVDPAVFGVGPPGLVDTVPSGKTLRGSYSAVGMGVSGGVQRFATAGVTFAIPFVSAPTPHFIIKGEAPPAECPGNAASPAAAPGHLCVYEGGQVANGTPEIRDPAMQGSPGTRPWGFVVLVTPSFDGDSGYGTWGSWSATAP